MSPFWIGFIIGAVIGGFVSCLGLCAIINGRKTGEPPPDLASTGCGQGGGEFSPPSSPHSTKTCSECPEFNRLMNDPTYGYCPLSGSCPRGDEVMCDDGLYFIQEDMKYDELGV